MNEQECIAVSESLINHVLSTFVRSSDTIDSASVVLNDGTCDLVIEGVKDKAVRLVEYRIRASFSVEVVRYSTEEQILDLHQTEPTRVEGRNTVDSVLTQFADDPLRDFFLDYEPILPRPDGYRLVLAMDALGEALAGATLTELLPVSAIRIDDGQLLVVCDG